MSARWIAAARAAAIPWRGARREFNLNRCPQRRAAGTTASQCWAIESIVNLEAFPLHDLDSERVREVVAEHQQQMRTDGYCVLKRFLQPAAVVAAVEEVRGREDSCFVQSRRINIWGENPQQHGNLSTTAVRRLSSHDMYGMLKLSVLHLLFSFHRQRCKQLFIST